MSVTFLVSGTVHHESVVVANLKGHTAIQNLSSVDGELVVVMVHRGPLGEVSKVTCLGYRHFEFGENLKILLACISQVLTRFSTVSSREPMFPQK